MAELKRVIWHFSAIVARLQLLEAFDRTRDRLITESILPGKKKNCT
jgi:hypothetical protein